MSSPRWLKGAIIAAWLALTSGVALFLLWAAILSTGGYFGTSPPPDVYPQAIQGAIAGGIIGMFGPFVLWLRNRRWYWLISGALFLVAGLLLALDLYQRS
jgi:hypothetical protein